MKLKRIWTGLAFLGSITLVMAFQNCSNTKMGFSQSSSMAQLSASYGMDDSFTTNENVALTAAPSQTLAKETGNPSVFSQATSPVNGTLSNYNAATGGFTYTPNADFVGSDSFQYSELATSATTAATRRIGITVLPVNQAPWLNAQTFSFGMNSRNNAMAVLGSDKVDKNPRVLLDLKGFVNKVSTTYGTLTMTSPGQFAYTPQSNFRGMDSVLMYVVNEFGLSSSQTMTINVGNPFLDLEPAMAVRGPGCTNCHSNLGSTFITDAGFGSSYFFGHTSSTNSFIDGPVDIYGDRENTSWISASFASNVIVQQAVFNFSLSADATAAYNGQVAAKSAITVNPALPQFAAKTLAQYVSAIESQVTTPALSVTEKANVYIGAPSAALLNTRTGGTGTAAYNFIKNDTINSPALSGLTDMGTYFLVGSSGMTCDGDLVISKTLYLNNPLIITANGCRIYSTKSIFVQGEITYQKLDPNAADNTNLQLVSSSWVNLGVGMSECESKTNPGWYYGSNGTQASPATFRLLSYPFPTRQAPDTATAANLNNTLLTELKSLPNFEDASCHNSGAGVAPRQVKFERLLINAPRIDSRYTGQFTGVLVAETPLMSLNGFAFTYDTVFNRVAVLPLMTAADFLSVQ